MHRPRVALALLVGAVSSVSLATPAYADPVVTTDGSGWVDTGIYVPGSAGAGQPLVQPVSGGSSGGTPSRTCTYTLDGSNTVHEWDLVPGHEAGVNGYNYFRACSDGTLDVIWVPNGTAPGDPAVPTVTPAQLAMEARDRLVLRRPVVHRSPTETNNYEGDPFTWANIPTWFWSSTASYQPQSQTVSVGPVSARVVAEPVGLLFDPGDGGDPVRCPGPGKAWTEADGNDEPASGCSYRYARVTDGAIRSRLGILWQVTWTGTGGTGGALPIMQTVTDAPLRVLQIQVVNR